MRLKPFPSAAISQEMQQYLMAWHAGVFMHGSVIIARFHSSSCSHSKPVRARLHNSMRWPSLVQGSVHRARWRGTQVALKTINHCSSGETNLAVSREVMVGQVMSHPNLVSSSSWPAPSLSF